MPKTTITPSVCSCHGCIYMRSITSASVPDGKEVTIIGCVLFGENTFKNLAQPLGCEYKQTRRDK